MIMVEGSDLEIVNLKSLLLYFKAMRGLKIKLDKSEVVVDILRLSSCGLRTKT